ncbi:hypothetical protein A2U01_0109700, partial [Trifolium medium]|nr:hypothetical protein [Trifolium medium]
WCGQCRSTSVNAGALPPTTGPPPPATVDHRKSGFSRRSPEVRC